MGKGRIGAATNLRTKRSLGMTGGPERKTWKAQRPMRLLQRFVDRARAKVTDPMAPRLVKR
jgi:hypothetical protein